VPHTSPGRTPPDIEQQVVALRRAHPAWGGRKIQARLVALGHTGVPAPSTITGILRRHGLLDPRESAKHTPWQRFEHEAPNDLWQMDFKGHFPLEAGGRCHPLTVLDDHSRYALALAACGNERDGTVRGELVPLFRRYGLPRRILADNGAPWGDAGDQPYTRLAVWLMRLGIVVTHGRPAHPQTQGKDERFHRTLKAELLAHRHFRDLADCQTHFDPWRTMYNHERPHQALGLVPPATRYQASPRSYPETLPPIEYGPDDHVRKVQHGGWLTFRGRQLRVSKAFHGERIALRPTTTDGRFEAYYVHQKIAMFHLRTPDHPSIF
jgi:transposase InsO family protein